MNEIKKVKCDLVGVNGNAFSVMGHWRRIAVKSGWTKNEIDDVIKEATSSDYDHLLATIQKHCE